MSELEYKGVRFHTDSAGVVYEWCDGYNAWIYYTSLCGMTLRAAVIAEMGRQEAEFNREYMNR